MFYLFLFLFQSLGHLEDAYVLEHLAKLLETRAAASRMEGLRLIRYGLVGSEAENILPRFITLLQAPRLVVGLEVCVATCLIDCRSRSCSDLVFPLSSVFPVIPVQG